MKDDVSRVEPSVATYRADVKEDRFGTGCSAITVGDPVGFQADQALGQPDALSLIQYARRVMVTGQPSLALPALLRVPDLTEGYVEWQTAAALLKRAVESGHKPTAKRTARLWIASSYTTVQFALLLRLAAWREKIDLDIVEGGFDQYIQEIVDPNSSMYRFAPDIIVIAVHAGVVDFPAYSIDPAAIVQAESARWLNLWAAIKKFSSAAIVMHSFALPAEMPYGHLSRGLGGTRAAMLDDLNTALARSATEDGGVSIVDCDRLAALIGKRHWFSPRYWQLSRQAISFSGLPLLARHTTAVIAARLGLAKKCIVLDLDNTLWGGIVGEDGVHGIRIGSAFHDGEAYQDFQAYLRALQQRGVLLAVCSKNNLADAREPFEARPEMILRLADFVAFEANWKPKSDNLQSIARELNIGLDSIVFVDDNPAEREIIRQMLPEVEVLGLPEDPSEYVTALSEASLFETTEITTEDALRTSQYQALAEAGKLSKSASSLEEFYSSLHMKARLGALKESTIPRVVQLLGKSNQSISRRGAALRPRSGALCRIQTTRF